MTETDWVVLFSSRAAGSEFLPWSDPQTLTDSERRLVCASIQQFQLGEGSDGSGLIRRGRASRLAALNVNFIPSLELFIKEEQRHSRHLARFLQREGVALLQQHWVDRVFRRVRKIAGLELCLRVLVMAEIVAVPYYTALQRATGSALLQRICANILVDEADHLRFQAENLKLLQSSRPSLPRLELLFWRCFQLATLLVVWREHGGVLRAAGYGWNSFRNECVRLLVAVSHNDFGSRAAETQVPAAAND
jgi:1,2-phenylacetyl-CoA epoxidase catalytic subunit